MTSINNESTNVPTVSYNSARFTQSASKLNNCPPDNGIEVAFAGRSNAGKSSAINSITNNKKLARTSKTPGRTQLINFFGLSSPRIRLVDLPGYGYAKVSLDIKADWGRHLDDYLRNRDGLAGLVLIMDIRKPLTEFDNMLLDWSNQRNLPTIILLTKSDKMKYGPAKQVFFQVKKALEDHQSLKDVILFSSLKKSGIEESRKAITEVIHARFNEDLFNENQLNEEPLEEPLEEASLEELIEGQHSEESDIESDDALE